MARGVEVQEVQHTHIEASLLYMYIYIHIYLYHMQKVFFCWEVGFLKNLQLDRRMCSDLLRFGPRAYGFNIFFRGVPSKAIE